MLIGDRRVTLAVVVRPLLVLAVTLTACSSREVLRSEAPVPSISEGRSAETVLYVDERALAPPDGSIQLPFRTLAEALATASSTEPVVIELASGIYEGPFVLRKNLVIRGRGGAVVLRADGEVVVTAQGGALDRVFIQGGKTGLRVEGAV